MQSDYEGIDFLSELSRKTTAYHDASADRVEAARLEYLEALQNFYSAQGDATYGTRVKLGFVDTE